jgi:hypothetical protein
MSGIRLRFVELEPIADSGRDTPHVDLLLRLTLSVVIYCVELTIR